MFLRVWLIDFYMMDSKSNTFFSYRNDDGGVSFVS